MSGKRKKNAKASTMIHASRAKARTSRAAKSQSWFKKSTDFSRNTIITVIVLAMLVVILFVLMKLFLDSETVVKREVEKITADYYENYYYYPIIINNSKAGDKPVEEILEKYHERGLVAVPLRQLLLFDNRRHANSANLLNKYCDENATYVRIFPDPPYGKTDYHVEYKYSCAF